MRTVTWTVPWVTLASSLPSRALIVLGLLTGRTGIEACWTRVESIKLSSAPEFTNRQGLT